VKAFRSLLFVPAHRAGWGRKAAASRPDALILDLEDAVPASEKLAARELLRTQIEDARAERADIGIVVRINDLSTADSALDLEVVRSLRIDALMIPKIESKADIEGLDAILSFIERRDGRSSTLQLIPTLETARGLVSAVDIASGPRVGGLATGAANNGDTARSVGFRWTAEGRETLTLRSNVVLAARAAGVEPFIGLWQEIADLDGLRSFAEDNRDLGYAGQCVIHPSHVAVANDVFTATEDEVRFYEGMIAAYEASVAAGRGALVYDGQHIDQAHVQTAKTIVAAARSQGPG
jgi:citrate lyase subunit beta/citryl-CoA lyase